MQRRAFLARLFGYASLAAPPLIAPAAARAAPSRRLLLQTSPLAGFQYHHGETLWPDLYPGAPLTLAREPDNPRDPRAIRVDYLGRKLGYVPRAENTTLASLMDRGRPLQARVRAKRASTDPWQRLELEIFLVG
jgi:hypothetical protein